MVSLLIAYASWSGNTKEVAELVQGHLREAGIEVTMHRIGVGEPTPDVDAFDAFMIGSFTWGKGATPVKVKNFIAEIGYKPPLVYTFGTGDTQFGGDDLFCLAAVKLAKFYHSPIRPLLIEQSPRGSQEKEVARWAEEVIKDYQRRNWKK